MGRHKRIPSVYLIMAPNKKGYVGQTVWPCVRMNKYKLGYGKVQAEEEGLTYPRKFLREFVGCEQEVNR